MARIGQVKQRLLNERYAKGREDGIAEKVNERGTTEEAIFDSGYDAGYDEGYKTAIGEAYSPNL